MSASLLLVASCLLFSSSGAIGGSHDDARVQSLPGWSGDLPSAHYSGYVDVSPGRMHYVFVESENECGHQDGQVPLVLWVQGGPGCSSLLGFFTEVGTFTVLPTNGSELRLALNAHRWSKCAHMLYWESPVGVGFSYSSTHQYKTNDSHVADINLEFLVNWFKEYPEYASLDFYIAGESYAGIYIPMVTSRIYEHNNRAKATDANAAGSINLKGILVGNGCIGNEVGSCSATYDLGYALPYLFNHGFIGDSVYYLVHQACAGQASPISGSCVAAVSAAYASVGQINVYNVLGTCFLSNSSSSRSSSSLLLRPASRLKDVQGLPECVIGPYTQVYLQDKLVQKALNIVPGTELAPWTACSHTLHTFYGETVPSVLPDYEKFIGHYRVVVYNGDADCRIPFTDNKDWTEDMAIKLDLKTVSSWRPWLIEESQVGGYITKYSQDFTFLTVRGAGHMVPQFKPQAAFDMFRRFLAGDL